MTLTQIGEEFQVNRETVRLWITRGELQARRAGRKYIVRRSDILQFVHSSSQSADGLQLSDQGALPAGERVGLAEDQRPPTPGSRLTLSAAGVSSGG